MSALFFAWNSGAPALGSPPGLYPPCPPHCYATAMANICPLVRVRAYIIGGSSPSCWGQASYFWSEAIWPKPNARAGSVGGGVRAPTS